MAHDVRHDPLHPATEHFRDAPVDGCSCRPGAVPRRARSQLVRGRTAHAKRPSEEWVGELWGVKYRARSLGGDLNDDTAFHPRWVRWRERTSSGSSRDASHRCLSRWTSQEDSDYDDVRSIEGRWRSPGAVGAHPVVIARPGVYTKSAWAGGQHPGPRRGMDAGVDVAARRPQKIWHIRRATQLARAAATFRSDVCACDVRPNG